MEPVDFKLGPLTPGSAGNRDVGQQDGPREDPVEWVGTDDPNVRVTTAKPHPICEVFGHDWELNPVATLLVFVQEEYAYSTFTAMCRRCPVAAQIDSRQTNERTDFPHHPLCSNFNAVDPDGRHYGVRECGCNPEGRLFSAASCQPANEKGV